MNYSWPGNVRELNNFTERLCVLFEGTVADEKDVSACLEDAPRIDGGQSTHKNLSSAALLSEKEMIRQVLENSRNKREAAHTLGIDPSTLWRKMKKHGLS